MTEQINIQKREEAMTEGLRSYIPGLISKKGWEQDEWRGRCLMAGLSIPTADRLMEGDTSVTLKTLRKVAEILEVRSIAQLVEFADE